MVFPFQAVCINKVLFFSDFSFVRNFKIVFILCLFAFPYSSFSVIPASSSFLLHYSDSSSNTSIPVSPDSFATSSLHTTSTAGLSLNFGTLLGGNGIVTSIAVDAEDNSYITGHAGSMNFPTKNAFNATFGGDTDVFVAKFDSTGNLLFSTFLGGSGSDFGSAIVVDSQGNSYITGNTGSSNFPTKNAFNATYGGGNDAFVAKFNATGNLVFSTFLGGSGSDFGSAIAVDGQGDSYITGTTLSSNFPTKNAFNATYGGLNSAFVAKFDSTGNLVFSTFLGGSGSDVSTDIAVDGQGNSYITGSTQSSNFITKNAFQPVFGGGTDVFVAKFNATGNLVFSTFLGSTDDDWGTGIAIDSQGDSYITGWTGPNSNFPTKNVFNASYGGGLINVFVAKFNSTGNLLFSTFLGGTNIDRGTGIAIDSQGNSYLTGYTFSNNFPTKNAYNSTYSGLGSAFVVKFNSTGTLLFSTFLGIAEPDDTYGITIDGQGNSYITGIGGVNVFITKFNLVPIFGPDSSTRSSLDFNSNFFNNYPFLSFCALGIVVLVVIYTVVEYRKYLSGKTNLSVQNKGSFKQFLIKAFPIKLKHKHQASNQLSDEIFKLLDEIEKENTPDK